MISCEKDLIKRLEQVAITNGRLQERNEALLMKVTALESELVHAKMKAKAAAKKDTEENTIKLMAICLELPYNKIAQIKAIRELTDFGLKKAKDLCVEAWNRAGQSWNLPSHRNQEE